MDEFCEPEYFIRVCVSRELTAKEFEDLTEIIDDEIADIVASDNVLEYQDEEQMFCYMFELHSSVDNCAQGPSAVDLIEFEVDQLIPKKLVWKIETNR